MNANGKTVFPNKLRVNTWLENMFILKCNGVCLSFFGEICTPQILFLDTPITGLFQLSKNTPLPQGCFGLQMSHFHPMAIPDALNKTGPKCSVIALAELPFHVFSVNSYPH